MKQAKTYPLYQPKDELRVLHVPAVGNDGGKVLPVGRTNYDWKSYTYGDGRYPLRLRGGILLDFSSREVVPA